MVNILIVTHGPLAQAFKESSRMFFGDAVDALETIGLAVGESPEQLKNEIIEKIVGVFHGGKYAHCDGSLIECIDHENE